MTKSEHDMKNNIVLIGMMGAGKSSVAQLLAKNLPEFTLCDVDWLIENDEKMPISEIFEKFGEGKFRELETKKLEEIANKTNQIIATGGGAFENPFNRKLLLENGSVFYLKASAEELFDRIKSQTHRPLLQKGFGVEKIREILEIRQTNYEKAHFVIDTTSKSFYNIVNEILRNREINE